MPNAVTGDDDMESNTRKIDIKKLIIYLLKRAWLIALCAGIGFAGMFFYSEYKKVDTYTASATMYVINANPNLVNYQYANASDLSSAVQLLDTYMVVVRSNKVMDVVAERLNKQYPGIPANYISSTLSMGSVSQTGVLQINSTTVDPQLSADICNAVVDVAPAEIIRVVNAGNIEVIDYAMAPTSPDPYSSTKKGIYGALAAGVLVAGIMIFLFLINHKVTDAESLSENYTPPVLAAIKRQKKNVPCASAYLINDMSPLELIESYAKLRMNLLYTMVGKENRIVAITSAISGEGKSTIAANLAISCAMSGKNVLLVDADMRRACQKENFEYDEKSPGLSDVLIGNVHWWDAVLSTDQDNLKILPAGQMPPNPAELLSLPFVQDLFPQMQQDFDLVLMDLPPINVVSDPLVISNYVAGCLFVVRQNYSDHRAIKKALISAELTGMNPLGFVYYGDDIIEKSYYNRKYYNKKYAYRRPDPS